MIPAPDRINAVTLIDEACASGATKKKACETLDLSVRTYQRWVADSGVREDARPTATRPRPANALSMDERQKILDYCNRPEYADLNPKQLVPRLIDKGIYIGSESTIYRLLREMKQMSRRGKSKQPKQRAKPNEYIARSPGEVITWDITYLRSDIKGLFFYLYLFIDVYSRKVIGWEVHNHESSMSAALLLRQISLKEGFSLKPEVIVHSDNGGPMKGATMAATMDKLGITPSFSRPSVSNDNAYSESIFKTLKYRPSYPNQAFESLDAARKWVNKFVAWYNREHRHSSIKYVTPEQRHRGDDVVLLERRHERYQAEREVHPERWTGNTRDWSHQSSVVLNQDVRKEIDMAA